MHVRPVLLLEIPFRAVLQKIDQRLFTQLVADAVERGWDTALVTHLWNLRFKIGVANRFDTADFATLVTGIAI